MTVQCPKMAFIQIGRNRPLFNSSFIAQVNLYPQQSQLMCQICNFDWEKIPHAFAYWSAAVTCYNVSDLFGQYMLDIWIPYLCEELVCQSQYP